ncbi:O-sialoglycoprotein endopeptidase [Proteinivorax hydrogeniformans]|uniref:N(6)-L-threonylcarbamoyladenine synthase n=1 Tax=Proteinivorax hydrogeniformans TaxID=1826727 RepID=A0AAU8HQF7_9FIRM
MTVLGIDTSNYTTSLAVVNKGGEVLCDHRKVLDVTHGKKGLRQSEAFYQHCNNLPGLFSDLKSSKFLESVSAIAVSKTPRNIEGSYMPVFTAGVNMASILADALSLPIYNCSHQEGHIYAGMVPNGLEAPFITLHLSGGTTDLLKVEAENDYRLKVEQLGTSSDLHCGQFVDRVGVKLGLKFPCGQEMEKMALQSNNPQKGLIPSSVSGGDVSFSGPLTKALNLLEQGVPPEELSFNVFNTIAKTAEKMIRFGVSQTDTKEVLLVGGVASNKQIRNWLSNRLKLNIHFATPKLSRDNAVGVALMGLKALK